MSTPRLILAAPESGSGKTMITAGLCHVLRQRGLTVQAFKAGPDYIDPSYHLLASGRPCRNLDVWMLPKTAVHDSFSRNSKDADIAVIEGVMGLFDGFGVEDDTGSTADIAGLLNAPVILILPVRGMARSAAAMVHGYNSFSPSLKLAGVILNKVGSPRHAEMCKVAIEKETAVPVLGYLPRNDEFALPERHLGLIPTNEAGDWTAVIEKIGQQLAETVAIDQLLAIAGYTGAKRPPAVSPPSNQPQESMVRIGVAEDEAFSFTYPENVELLAEAGAEIVPFSPIRDAALPEKLDGLILSGGFPELYAEALSNNRAMHQAIQTAVLHNLPIYAECGGLMYLTQSICDQQQKEWPMVGVLPGHSAMTKRVTLGYRLVEAVTNGPVLLAGEQVRGHEFHYSSWTVGEETDISTGSVAVSPAYLLRNPRQPDQIMRQAGIQLGSIWASYIHLHFLAKPGMADRFVSWCREQAHEQKEA
ncbi:MAG: cobyrinate a,c-diamide synthase [Chloroflexota bacterium]